MVVATLRQLFAISSLLPRARRITATTPVAISGPAAGHAALRTAADPSGRRVLGALAGGGITLTPWGTALVGEQGFARAFVTADQPTGLERRYGLNRSGGEAASGTPGSRLLTR